ncbi:hypothetical protein BDR03DRAFT_871638 [Suillus americanus]|nr:hypothetical protein BDR03DRAFT_871638 [Suillus americanus]
MVVLAHSHQINRKQCILVNESTTLRRHAEANFAVRGKYRQWAKKHSFESMLPGDIKSRKEKAEQAQQTINSHLTERKLAERVIPYSDKLFKRAAIKWLVATDQPIQALDHPKFQDMINVASRATNGVKIPGRKATRTEIMRIFKNHLTRLRTTLNVCHNLVLCASLHLICQHRVLLLVAQ